MVRTLGKMAAGLACVAILGWTTMAAGDEPVRSVKTGASAPATDVKATSQATFRASKLMGLSVKNAQGEKVGTIEDFVINPHDGKVAYAAMGVGGVFGLGEKLFAIPFTALRFEHGKDEMHFFVDMSKEKLQAAPGFDKHDWPNFADPNWAEKIDQYYRAAETKTSKTTTTTTVEEK